MFESLVASALSKWLGRYIDGLDTKHVHLWDGKATQITIIRPFDQEHVLRNRMRCGRVRGYSIGTWMRAPTRRPCLMDWANTATRDPGDFLLAYP